MGRGANGRGGGSLAQNKSIITIYREVEGWGSAKRECVCGGGVGGGGKLSLTPTKKGELILFVCGGGGGHNKFSGSQLKTSSQPLNQPLSSTM